MQNPRQNLHAVARRATSLDDISDFNWGLHLLSGNKEGQYAIKVSGNWRLFFKFDQLIGHPLWVTSVAPVF